MSTLGKRLQSDIFNIQKVEFLRGKDSPHLIEKTQICRHGLEG
jgi:hypothetical protein